MTSSEQFYINIDLHQNQLLNTIYHVVEVFPNNPKIGQFCYLSNNYGTYKGNLPYYYNGFDWVTYAGLFDFVPQNRTISIDGDIIAPSKSLLSDVLLNSSIDKIKGVPLVINSLINNQFIMYDGINYKNISLSLQLTGDVSSLVTPLNGNNSLSVTVNSIKGITVPTPTPGVLRFNGTTFIFDNTAPDSSIRSINTMLGPDILISGTPNQVIINNSSNDVQLSLPQDIAPTSTPTFSKITLTSTPTAGSDAANKAYVDGLLSGLKDFKDSVKLATTANIILSGLQTIDGVATVAGDRILVKNQTDAKENGIYVTNVGIWTRASDFQVGSISKITLGVYVYVEFGNANNKLAFILSSSNAPNPSTSIRVGTDTITFTVFGASGSVTSVGLSTPSIFTVSGSPVTSSGNLSFNWNDSSSNFVLGDGTTVARSNYLLATSISGITGQVGVFNSTNSISSSSGLIYQFNELITRNKIIIHDALGFGSASLQFRGTDLTSAYELYYYGTGLNLNEYDSSGVLISSVLSISKGTTGSITIGGISTKPIIISSLNTGVVKSQSGVLQNITGSPTDIVLVNGTSLPQTTFVTGGPYLPISGGTETGMVTLAAGTTTLAPLSFQAGVLLTTPVAHRLEWNGTNLYVTNSSATRNQLSYVTSIGLTAPTLFTVTGSPLTTSGTLSFAWNGSSTNLVRADGSTVAQSTFLTANQTITLSGDVTGSGTTTITTSISAATVTGKTLTGYTIGTNTAIAATDTIIEAFGKIQAQINATPGTVTSVSLTTPSIFTVSGSPITSSGALSFAWNGSSTNLVRADGSTVAQSTFLTGNQTITLSGDVTGSGTTAITTSISAATVTGKALTGYVVGTNTALAATDTILGAFGKIQAQINARPGTVTSVGLSAPSIFTVSGSPVTGSGTLSFAWNGSSANLVRADGSTVSASTYLTGSGSGSYIPMWSSSSVLTNSPLSSSAGYGGITNTASSLPAYSLVDTSQASNAKNWTIRASGSTFVIDAFDDAWTSANRAVAISRSGNVIGNMSLQSSSINLTALTSAGFVKTNASGLLSVDTNAYVTNATVGGLGSDYFVQGNGGSAYGHRTTALGAATTIPVTQSGFYDAQYATDGPQGALWTHLIRSTHTGTTADASNKWHLDIAAPFLGGNGTEGYYVRTSYGGGTPGTTGWRQLWHSGNLTSSTLPGGPYVPLAGSVTVSGGLVVGPYSSTGAALATGDAQYGISGYGGALNLWAAPGGQVISQRNFTVLGSVVATTTLTWGGGVTIPTSGYVVQGNGAGDYGHRTTSIELTPPDNLLSSGFYDGRTSMPSGTYWTHMIRSAHSDPTNVKGRWSFDIAANFAGSVGNGENYFVRTNTDVSWGTWRTLWHSGNLLNLNQLINGPGYITNANAANIDVTEHSTNNVYYPVVWDNTGRSLFHTAGKLSFNPLIGVLKATALWSTTTLSWGGGWFQDLYGNTDYTGLYGSGVQPSYTPYNYSLAASKNGAWTYINGTTSSHLAVGGAAVASATTGLLSVTGALTASGLITSGLAAMGTWTVASDTFAWFGAYNQNNGTNGNSGYLQSITNGTLYACVPSGSYFNVQVNGADRLSVAYSTTTVSNNLTVSGTINNLKIQDQAYGPGDNSSKTAIYGLNVSPTSSNYSLLVRKDGTYSFLNGTSLCGLDVNNADILVAYSDRVVANYRIEAPTIKCSIQRISSSSAIANMSAFWIFPANGYTGTLTLPTNPSDGCSFGISMRYGTSNASCFNAVSGGSINIVYDYYSYGTTVTGLGQNSHIIFAVYDVIANVWYMSS